MSSLRRAAAAGAGLVIVTAAALIGQTPDERARLDRLARRYEALDARAKQMAEAGAPGVDSVRVGTLLILTDSSGSAVFQEARQRFQRALEERLDTIGFPLLAGARIGVRFGNPHPGWGHLVSGDAQLITVQLRHRTPEWLDGQLSHAVDALLARRGGASLAAWRADVRLFQDPAPLREATYLELLMARVPSAQGCYEGSLDACARGLNLTPDLPERSAEANAALRRFIARHLNHRAGETALAPSYAACVERGDDAACLTFLERAGLQEPTLSTRAAGTLLATVRDLGGPAALARFFADTGATIVPRLEAAAAMPIDSLLARWRDTILAHRPVPTSVPGAMQWLVIGWAGVFIAFATRSTRWR